MHPGIFAETLPDKAAVIHAATGEQRSYRQLDARANQLAQLLYARGLRPGDHLALLSENTLEFFEVMIACMRSGLYLTPINHHLPAEQAAYIVNDCDARALVASATLEQTEALGRAVPLCEVKLSVKGAIAGFDSYEAAVENYPAPRLAQPRAGALMVYSSGTTGRPKGILRPLPEQALERGLPGAQLIVDLFKLNSDVIYLSPAPMYHGAPLGFTLATLQAGGTVVMMDRFDAEAALALIERYRITHSQWVPTMFIRMLKLPAEVQARYDLSSHVCAIHAAAPCPIEVKRQMIEWWGPIIEEYYNATESVGLAQISAEAWLEHPGSVGRSIGKPFHICNEDGVELPPGEVGLIYGESPTGVHFAYHKDAGKTAAASHPQQRGWATVGDLGYLDAEGYLYLTDRKAFMIISGGVNIYPQQIEDVLALHPAIGDIAVIGVPNEELGEEVKAVIEPAAGVELTPQLSQEILDFVRVRLGRQLTPRSIDFVGALPRLPTGKLYKQALRDSYWKRQDK